ncbi:MAG: MotA/TolQ/ExbB proton channel family protein [Desulfobacteraceae bacterium]|nr:MotA/TolQ/ExbB proton channel family protein [Desulfobacteraceae bacterium]MBC2720007.1 MotA/TolQ/ExbB proton channel family protein [Desulfobacteraceae bacterium]
MFDILADSIIKTLTYIITTNSGILQIAVYCLMIITFCSALIKTYQSFCILAYCNPDEIAKKRSFGNFYINIKTPLFVIAVTFFEKAKKHYLEEKENDQGADKIIPPDAFIRDAAFQFTERYFERTFLEPISMLANILPPLGFIGTIMGMVIHFLSNTEGLKSEIMISGIATALYTTFIGLICYTFLEFIKRISYTLAQKRIDEGLAAVSENRYKKDNNNKQDQGKK